MGSIGWYILGYLGLGMVTWLLGAIAIVMYAAVLDIRYDLKNDNSMERADTVDALHDVAKQADESLQDQCLMSQNPQQYYAMQMFKALLLWPMVIPKGFTTLWIQAKELRKIRRGY